MSDPRTPSRAERERLRALAEQARDRLAEAQAIYAQEGQTPRWGTANLKYLVALGDYHGVCSPSVVLSLLAALDEGEREEEVPVDARWKTSPDGVPEDA